MTSCLVSTEPLTHFHVVVEYPAAEAAAAAAVSIFVHLSLLGAALGWKSATAEARIFYGRGDMLLAILFKGS